MGDSLYYSATSVSAGLGMHPFFLSSFSPAIYSVAAGLTLLPKQTCSPLPSPTYADLKVPAGVTIEQTNSFQNWMLILNGGNLIFYKAFPAELVSVTDILGIEIGAL